MRNFVCALTLLTVGGCEVFDPYQREATWRPTNANDANLAAQVVRPSDLVRGGEYTPRDSSMTTAAITRYRTGRIKPLPDSALSTIRLQGNGNAEAGNAAAEAPTGTVAAAAP